MKIHSIYFLFFALFSISIQEIIICAPTNFINEDDKLEKLKQQSKKIMGDIIDNENINPGYSSENINELLKTYKFLQDLLQKKEIEKNKQKEANLENKIQKISELIKYIEPFFISPEAILNNILDLKKNKLIGA